MSSWVRALHVTYFGGAGKVLLSIAGAGETPGRFSPEVGARILGALDAAHASEQPAAGWDNEGPAPEDIPARTSRQDPFPAEPGTAAGARESVAVRRTEDAEVFLADVPRGTFIRGPSRTVRRADTPACMVERLFEQGDVPALSPDRHKIVVHVEAEVLADGRAGRCEIEYRTAIAAETARRLCCDAGIVSVVDGANGEPLGIGRRARSIPPSVRRAPARGAHRLRPCVDGRDGIVGLGRHSTGGGADRRGLESVVGDACRVRGKPGWCRVPARSWR